MKRSFEMFRDTSINSNSELSDSSNNFIMNPNNKKVIIDLDIKNSFESATESSNDSADDNSSSSDSSDDNSSSNDSSSDSSNDSSSDSSNASSAIDYFSEEDRYYKAVSFEPSYLEKQIIRNTFAMLTKTNMYDWNADVSTDTEQYMNLCNFSVISNSDGSSQFSEFAEIVVHLEYTQTYTYCQIEYRLTDFGRNYFKLNLIWDTSPLDTNILRIEKEEAVPHLFFFSKNVYKRYEISSEDRPDLSWCYFQDVHYHLNRIS